MKVLVPVDGSENSFRAAGYVLNMAIKNPSGVEVILITVPTRYDADYFADSWVGEEKLNSDIVDLFAGKMERVKRIFADAGIPVKAEVIPGEPGSVIVNYIEKNGIDEVYMGGRGLSALMGMIMGSVTYKVLTSTRVPVTVVK